MHTTRQDSLALLHNGNFRGGMYLQTPEGAGIVVTHTVLEAALATALETAPDDEWLTLQGPDSSAYTWQDVTTRDEASIRPGDWSQATIRVKRDDLANLLVFSRTQRVIAVLEQVSVQQLKVGELIRRVDKFVEHALALQRDNARKRSV